MSMKPLEMQDGPEHSGTKKPDKGVVKAGFLIQGADSNGRQSIVAAYNEGRLGAKYKAYLLPTGTVNEGEHVLDAASRETFEETGIDVKEMIGRNNFDRLKQMYDEGKEEYLDFGKDGFDVQSGPYHGVSILRIKVKPQDFTYVSHAGVPKRTQLFEVELKPKTIEVFRENWTLKNHANTADEKSSGKVKKTTWQQIRKNGYNQPYPTFKEMLSWLRTGDMPENRPWNKGKEVPPNLYHETPHGMETTGQLFERLEREFFKGKSVKWNHERWKEFCDTADGKDYKRLSKAFTAIKEIVDDMGITEGDKGTIKLDDKDFPLTFYQEGADVITAYDYFKHAEWLARAEPYYNRSFASLPENVEGVTHHPDSPLKSQYQVMTERFPDSYKYAKENDERDMLKDNGFVERLALIRNLENQRLGPVEGWIK